MKSFDDLVFEFAWHGFIIFDELDEKRCECEDCKAADHLNKREKEKRLLDSQHKIS